jgi:Lon protease-like protein
MTAGGRFEDLPATLPVFPLAGVLLLPRGKLPLNIFEPRYLNMTRDALGAGRLIGMIQPRHPADLADAPELYDVGCAGRISEFAETDDGRFLITLTGVCRFAIAGEIASTRGYRRVQADWDRFRADFDAADCAMLDRDRLTDRLRRYFDAHGITADWATIKETPDERLVTTLAMVCPFAPSEKQAMLETASLADRADMLLALLDMAAAGGSTDHGGEHARH